MFQQSLEKRQCQWCCSSNVDMLDIKPRTEWVPEAASALSSGFEGQWGWIGWARHALPLLHWSHGKMGLDPSDLSFTST